MYLAYLGVTIPLLRKRLRGLARQPPGRQGRAVRARRWGMPLNIDRDRLRRGDGHQPRVAARRALRRRHLQVGPDRRHDRSCSASGSSTTTPCSGTRAGCSRSTAPRPRRATDLRGVGGRRARPPRDGPHGRSAARTRPARRQGDPRRHRARRASPLVLAVLGLFSRADRRPRARCWAVLVQLNAIAAWLAGPRWMPERRLVLAPGVRGGHPGRAGRVCRLRRGGAFVALAPGRGARRRSCSA